MIHNFIRLNQGYEDAFDEWEQPAAQDEQKDEEMENKNSAQETTYLNVWRDGIAQSMWDKYQNYINNN